MKVGAPPLSRCPKKKKGVSQRGVAEDGEHAQGLRAPSFYLLLVPAVRRKTVPDGDLVGGPLAAAGDSLTAVLPSGGRVQGILPRAHLPDAPEPSTSDSVEAITWPAGAAG